MLNPRRSPALSFCTVSAISQLVTQPHTAPSLLAAASLHMHDGMIAGAIEVDNDDITAVATCMAMLVNSPQYPVLQTPISLSYLQTQVGPLGQKLPRTVQMKSLPGSRQQSVSTNSSGMQLQTIT